MLRGFSSLTLFVILFCLLISSFSVIPVFCQTTTLLDPKSIPQWVNQLDGPLPVFVPENVYNEDGKLVRQDYFVRASQFDQRILPSYDETGNPTGFGLTTVWGYEGEASDPLTGVALGRIRNSPGPSFEATVNIPVQVTWVNNLVDPQGNPLRHSFAVDPTLHWANPKGLQSPSLVSVPPFPPGYSVFQSPVPITPHLHGAEVSSLFDGHPDSWWTPDGRRGKAYNSVMPTDLNSAVYEYPNSQEPTTLWYHDHALGITRLNVFSGLAGFYLLKNPELPFLDILPSGEYDMPLLIQDRSFFSDGSFYFPSEGSNPLVHPYWNSAYLGDTVMVNGKVWPNMNVKQGLYRLRLLDGSNSRFYNFKFSNGMPFIQITSDGGYLKSPVELTSLLLGPAERADILVDFSGIPSGEKVILQNDALLDFEKEKDTLGQIVQFTVLDGQGFTKKELPSILNPTFSSNFPSLSSSRKERVLTLTSVSDPNGPVTLLLDGQRWGSPVSENPILGTTEDWIIVNPILNAHPIHLHLVQFQVVKRQDLNSSAYLSDWVDLNGEPPLDNPTRNVDSIESYLIGQPIYPPLNEQGWKDTVITYPDQITVIRIRISGQDGSDFPFDATVGPGYVWHCHILDHEDNEMMRPLTIVGVNNDFPLLLIITFLIIGALVTLLLLYVIKKRQLKY